MTLLGQASSEAPAKFSPSSDPAKAHIAFVNDIPYGSVYASQDLPKDEIPENGYPGKTAYQLIHDELELDGNANLNLASFVTTTMDEYADKLIMENLNKNAVDYEEYPSTVAIQNRCVNMIAKLFNAPAHPGKEAIGTSTIGSSEAIMLGVLAMKKKWEKARKAAGKDYYHPNIVMNSAVQVCWEKSSVYLSVEAKYVYCTPDRYVIDPQEAINLIDENTIGVVGILGTTYTGEFEDIKKLNDLLEQLNKDKGLDVYIHVDAASGGFYAPFVNPDLLWDFRLPRVVSINASGHKSGLTYPGVGWVVWRSKDYLPEELVFHVNYLGADQMSLNLNFSKSSVQIIAQYYALINYGKAGYRAIWQSLTVESDYLAEALEKSGRFVVMNPKGVDSLALVAFRMKEKKHYDEFAIAAGVRSRGIIIPAYTMAPHSEQLKLLRVVLRIGFTRSRCEAVIQAILDTCELLDKQSAESAKATVDMQTHHKKTKKAQSGGAETFKDKHSLRAKTGKDNILC